MVKPTTNIGQNGVSLLSFPSMSPLCLISAALQVSQGQCCKREPCWNRSSLQVSSDVVQDELHADMSYDRSIIDSL